MVISSMWILKNMDKRVLFQLCQNWSYNKLNKILILIDLCVSHFEYRSTVWSNTLAAACVSNGPGLGETGYVDQCKPSGKATSGGKKQAVTESGTVSGVPPVPSSNSKLKNKIEDLIIGSTQNVRNEIQRRNKYFSYTSLNPSSAGGEDETTKNELSMADVAKQAMFKWRRDLNNTRQHHHIDVLDNNSLDSMKLILEGRIREKLRSKIGLNLTNI